jgi:hypothetical protein
MKRLLLIFFTISCFALKSQTGGVLESDPLNGYVVLVLPTATVQQLNNLKLEFAKHPQIQSATYVYQGHNCLLIALADVMNPDFIYYRDLVKIVVGYGGINRQDILIKEPKAYTEITTGGIDSTSFTVK